MFNLYLIMVWLRTIYKALNITYHTMKISQWYININHYIIICFYHHKSSNNGVLVSFWELKIEIAVPIIKGDPIPSAVQRDLYTL
jgi:hypothetical protein